MRTKKVKDDDRSECPMVEGSVWHEKAPQGLKSSSISSASAATGPVRCVPEVESPS